MKNLDMFRGVTWEDALEADVMAAGGFKHIGSLLWKDMTIQQAAKKLRRVVNEDHRQGLKRLEEAVIIREAAKRGARNLVEYYAGMGNAKVIPVAPEDTKASINEEFEKAKDVILPLARRIIELERAEGYAFDREDISG